MGKEVTKVHKAVQKPGAAGSVTARAKCVQDMRPVKKLYKVVKDITIREI